MDYLMPLLLALAIGVVVLVAVTMVTRAPEQSLKSAFSEGMAWGIGFLVSDGVVIALELLPTL